MEPSKGVVDYFRNKCVLLTGGNQGIGLGAARLLRKSGAHLILVARSQEKLASAQEELSPIGANGAGLHTLSLDITDREATAAAVESLPGDRPVDVLINNAGYAIPGYFQDLPLSMYDEMMSTNFMGAMHLTKLLVPSMMERGSGHVTFVSSLVGLMGIFGYTAYAPSKFALRGFAEALRCEVKPYGVAVSVCYPPDTDTPGYIEENKHKPHETRALEGNAKALSPDEVADKLLQGMAAGKFHILCNGSSWFADFMHRLFPWMVRSVFDSDIKKAQTKGPGRHPVGSA
jgi:3-dehydrosphinganine reductase